MLKCTGTGFSLHKTIEQPELSNRVLFANIKVNNFRDVKESFWKVAFTESAFDFALSTSDGTYIDILDATIFSIDKKAYYRDSYIIGINEASLANEVDGNSILYVSARNAVIVDTIGVNAENNCFKAILVTSNTTTSDEISTWRAYFSGKSFEEAKLLKIKDFIDFENAVMMQKYRKEDGAFDVRLAIKSFKQSGILRQQPTVSDLPYDMDFQQQTVSTGIPPQGQQHLNTTPTGNFQGNLPYDMPSQQQAIAQQTQETQHFNTSPKENLQNKPFDMPLQQSIPITLPVQGQQYLYTDLQNNLPYDDMPLQPAAPNTQTNLPYSMPLQQQPTAPVTSLEELLTSDSLYDFSLYKKQQEEGYEPNLQPIPKVQLSTEDYDLAEDDYDSPESRYSADCYEDQQTLGKINQVDDAQSNDEYKKPEIRPAITKPNKYDKKIEKLTPKANAINEKISSDPFYIMTNAERKLMQSWQLLLLKKRKEEIRLAKKVISKKNTKLKQRKKAKTVIPRSTQQTIPYVADYEEGLFEVESNKFSKTYLMQDINYLVAHENEQQGIFESYGQFLNYFNDDMSVAITIDTHIVSISEQERKIFYAEKGDQYDLHRQEYNSILRQQIVAGRNDIKVTKYVTVTIDTETPYEALLRFHKIDAEVITNLRRIGSNATVLSTEDRLAVLHDKFRKGREGDLVIDFDFLKEQGISSKDYITPSSFQFEKSHFMIDDEYYRCLYVSNLPNTLVDTFLTELVDVDFPLLTTVSIQPLAQDKALRLIKKQLTGMEANKIEAEKRAFRSGYSPETISHNLKQSLRQAEALLDEVQTNDQKMFFVTVTLMVHGTTLEDLNEHCTILESRARQKTCQLQAFSYQQENAFKCTLPLGMPTYKKIFVERALTTEATAIFIPFAAQELYQVGGFYYGLNQMSRNLILCDRTSMKTPSGFILGSSGSGKSFATKREQLNVLLQNDKTSVIVIDPENEYGDFARAFHGTRINISMESDNYINPMDMGMNYGLEDDDEESLEMRKTKALQKKSDVIMSIIQSMISVGKKNDTIISPQQKTIVDRAVRRAYNKYLATDFNRDYLPTLMDLQAELDKERKTSKDGELMAEGVEYYTKGSMNVFSHKTNVDFDSRFVVFNVRDLGTQLKQIALLIILDFIWNRLMENFSEGLRTYCYVDEIHVLFQNEYSARFLQQLYKRGRKYGLVMTGITQNISDLLSTDMSRSMIANSDFLLMLNQAPEDLKILADMLKISEAQMSFVNRADAGCGLLFAEKVIVPFVDRFPTSSYLYKLMSTKFGEDYTTETVEDCRRALMFYNIDA